MTRTILIAAASLVMAGCLHAEPAPPATQGFCLAMKPEMPIAYHGGPDGKGGTGYDTADTVARVRRANARFRAVCPVN